MAFVWLHYESLIQFRIITPIIVVYIFFHYKLLKVWYTQGVSWERELWQTSGYCTFDENNKNVQ